ncbi:hypothetical protein BKA64DRAFT_681756 [Cadophora sp. MPI-SDFR-AT-0126]|nr:hypothetical protein BKA64DRAFT_681756 [Leotiomycetes sp. MPI-SDFR-AT-0126]
MRITHLALAVAVHAPSAISQTITHITQLSVFTDLPLCISTAVDHAFESVRQSDCPQTNPTSAASCICLKTGGPDRMSKSMTKLLPIWCVGLGYQGPDYVETVASGVSLFSEYCTGALGAAAVIAAPTATETTPTQTGAGLTTSASSPKPTSTATTTSNTPNTPNDSSSSSSPSPSSKSSSGLSLGEKLAIGISIPATLGTILGCYFTYKQHKTSQKEAEIRKTALRLSQFTPGQPSHQNATRSGH